MSNIMILQMCGPARKLSARAKDQIGATPDTWRQPRIGLPQSTRDRSRSLPDYRPGSQMGDSKYLSLVILS